MREIHVDEIAQTVRDLCLETNYVMGEDVRRMLAVAQQREVSPLGCRRSSLPRPWCCQSSATATEISAPCAASLAPAYRQTPT